MKLTKTMLKQFKTHLRNDEKAPLTIEKYVRDLQKLYSFLPGKKEITRELILEFKASLLPKYKNTTINGILTVINTFFDFINVPDCKVKLLKVQRRIFCDKGKLLTKEEYKRLLDAAKRKPSPKMYSVIQTLCATGIRISELTYITVEAVKEGRAVIYNKGKIREVLISNQLRKYLCQYCEDSGIRTGPVFVARSGRPLNRTNIWTAMKALCKTAEVDEKKVFPHNLRHLFALTYYEIEKDVVRLADVLGHSSIETTRIYTIFDGDNFEETFEKMGLIDEER